MKQFICRFGVPLLIHSDQGRNFESELFAEMCRLLCIKKTRTTPYHPQSEGMVERFNCTLEAQLSKFADHKQKDWDEHIPFLLMAYRSATHDTTHCSPVKMMLPTTRSWRSCVVIQSSEKEGFNSKNATPLARSLFHHQTNQ